MSLNKVVNATDYALDGKFREMKLTGGFEVDGASTLADIKCEDVNCNDIVGNSINTDTGDIDALECKSVISQAVNATSLLTNYKHVVYNDASGKYALAITTPLGFANNPTSLTAEFELKGVSVGATTLEMLCIRGNFTIVALLAAGSNPVSYNMTLTDPSLTALFVNADVPYKKGYGVGANGAGADSSYITGVDTSVEGQVVLTFENVSHLQTPQNFGIVHSFEVHLLRVIP